MVLVFILDGMKSWVGTPPSSLPMLSSCWRRGGQDRNYRQSEWSPIFANPNPDDSAGMCLRTLIIFCSVCVEILVISWGLQGERWMAVLFISLSQIQVCLWLYPGFSPLTCLFQLDQAEGFERKRLNDCGRSFLPTLLNGGTTPSPRYGCKTLNPKNPKWKTPSKVSGNPLFRNVGVMEWKTPSKVSGNPLFRNVGMNNIIARVLN